MELLFQHNSFSCGAYALINSFRTLGEDAVEYDEIKAAARTNRIDGTTKRGIVRGAKFYGFSPTVYRTKDKNLAWKWLYRNVARFPCILLCDGNAHWTACVGVTDHKVIWADSSDFNDGAMGLKVMDKEETLERWGDPKGFFYAVRIKRG